MDGAATLSSHLAEGVSHSVEDTTVKVEAGGLPLC